MAKQMIETGGCLERLDSLLTQKLKRWTEYLIAGDMESTTFYMRGREGGIYQICAGVGRQSGINGAIKAATEAADRLLMEQPVVNGNLFYIGLTGTLVSEAVTRIEDLVRDWYGRETPIILQTEYDEKKNGVIAVIMSGYFPQDMDTSLWEIEEHFEEYWIRKLCQRACGRTLEIPQGINVIRKETFRKKNHFPGDLGLMQNIETIVIPRSVYRIDINAFRGQQSLRKVVFGHGSRDKLMLGPGVFSRCPQLKELVNVPRYLNLYEVSEENPRTGLYKTFGGTSLKNLYLPDT